MRFGPVTARLSRTTAPRNIIRSMPELLRSTGTFGTPGARGGILCFFRLRHATRRLRTARAERKHVERRGSQPCVPNDLQAHHPRKPGAEPIHVEASAP